MSHQPLSAGLLQQLGVDVYSLRPDWQGDSSQSFESLAKGSEPVQPIEHDVMSTNAEMGGLNNEKSSSTVVLLGQGLSSIWEDEEHLEWRLLLNICTAMQWSESDLVMFDTDLLSTDEACYDVVEEVLALGSGMILSMNGEHQASEMLSEGLEVIEVPSLEQMLWDPYSKQTFYETIIQS